MVVSALVCATTLLASPIEERPGRVRMDIKDGIASLTVLNTETFQPVNVYDYVNVLPTNNVDYRAANAQFVRGLGSAPDYDREVIGNALGNQSWGGFFQGENMNSLGAFGNDGHAMMANIPTWEYNLGPGTVFVPDDPAYQNMIGYLSLKVSFTYENNLVAGINGILLAPQNGAMRTFCANMSKKEPDGTVKYYPYGNTDKVLVKLAELSSKSRQIGTQDQARIWIYTDKASLKEINERLSPPLIPGYYTRALREIDEAGGFKDADRKNKKLFDPALMFAPNGSKPASKYFFENMAKNFPRDVKAAFEKGFNNAIASLWDPNAQSLKNDHLNYMFEFLAPVKNTDVQVGLLTFLQKRVPSSERSRIGGLQMFSKVRALANSDDRKVADLAETVLKGYPAGN